MTKKISQKHFMVLLKIRDDFESKYQMIKNDLARTDKKTRLELLLDFKDMVDAMDEAIKILKRM